VNEPGVPLRTQPLKDQAWFVLRRGVLGWGVVVALAMFVQQFYKTGQWPPLAQLGTLVMVFGAAGVLHGILQMRTEKVRDPHKRCANCGEIDPNHTRWCAR
jgi:predicted phage tail protein